MSLACTLDHLGRKVDSDALYGFGRGKQITASASDLEYALSAGHQEAIDLRQAPMISTAPTGPVVQLASYIIPVRYARRPVRVGSAGWFVSEIRHESLVPLN